MSKIFSGPESQDIWDMIEKMKTISEAKQCLYTICCRLQELEGKCDRMAHPHASTMPPPAIDGTEPR